MKTLWEPRKDSLRRFTLNSLNGRGRSISYIYCERLNLLLRSVNDLTTTTGVCRGKSKAGMLSKHLESIHEREDAYPVAQDYAGLPPASPSVHQNWINGNVVALSLGDHVWGVCHFAIRDKGRLPPNICVLQSGTTYSSSTDRL